MAGFQFLHVNTYSRSAPKKKGKGKERKWTVRDIASEVERDPENSHHVEQPKPPTVVYGMGAKEAVAEAEKRAEASTDTAGRKVRTDAAILLAGVASHPTPVADLNDPEKREEYEHWRKATVDFLKNKYGDKLLSVVEHLDEKHPHVHFYAVPEAGKGFNAKTLHDGFKAAEGARDPREQKRLYCDGMRQLQDEFHQQVSVKTGQDRLGPKRQRMTRATWVEKQTTLTTAAKALRKLTSYVKAKFKKGYEDGQAKGYAAGTAKASKPAEMLAAAWGGITGHRKRLEREREEELAKERAKTEREAKAKKEAEAERDNLRKNTGEIVERHVALKMRGAVSELAKKDAKIAEQAKQLDSLSAENKDMRQQLRQRVPKPA